MLASWFSANPGVAASISSEHSNISNPDCGHLMLSPGGTNSASTRTPPRKPWVGPAHQTSPGLRESLGLPEGPEGSRALPASAPAWPPRGRCKPGRAPPGTGQAGPPGPASHPGPLREGPLGSASQLWPGCRGPTQLICLTTAVTNPPQVHGTRGLVFVHGLGIYPDTDMQNHKPERSSASKTVRVSSCRELSGE